MKTNQRGFSHIVILLLFVFIAVIGAVSYRLLTMPASQTAVNRAPDTKQVTPAADKPAEPEIPEGFVKYIDAKDVISFYHPEGWFVESYRNPNPDTDDSYVVMYDITKTTPRSEAFKNQQAHMNELRLAVTVSQYDNPGILPDPLISIEKIVGPIQVNGHDYDIVTMSQDNETFSSTVKDCNDKGCHTTISLKGNKYLNILITSQAAPGITSSRIDTTTQEYKDMLTIIKSIRSVK